MAKINRFKDNIVCLVLTDNYFLFYGLTSLFNNIEFHKINYDEVISDVSKYIMREKRITIIIDCNIFIRGKWLGFKKLSQCYPQAKRVWMMRWRRWGMWPDGCIGDPKLSLAIDIRSLLKKLTLILAGRSESNNKGDDLDPPAFNKTEKNVLASLLKNKDVHCLAKKMMRSEKTIYTLRCSIQSKFGFRTADWMVFIYQRNNEIFNDIWMNHLKECE